MSEIKIGTGETPSYLQPTANLVNATLADINGYLNNEAATQRGLSPAQAALLGVLPQATYDGMRTTAEDVRATLDPFIEQNIGYEKDDQFKQFVGDLEYVELLEQGGLDAVNVRVNELLEAVKADVSREQKADAMDRLNRLLYRAIYVFPHLATGLQVTLTPGTEGKSEEIWETYGYDYGSQRRKYEQLRDRYQEKYGASFPDRLTVPLPYGFTTGTHGSGERAAMGASREEIAFNFISGYSQRNPETQALGVEVGAPLIASRLTYFTMDEIEDVGFVSGQEFTPLISHSGELIDRANPVSHYLIFRDFGVYAAFRKRESLPELTDEEWKQCQTRLLSAPFHTNLWQEDMRFLRRGLLKKGFMALSADNADDITLYEYTNYAMPSEDQYESEAILLTRMMRGGDESLFVQTYQGMDIITRLMALPVAERRF